MRSLKTVVAQLFSRVSKKTLLMALAVTLATSGVASGTLAWLIDRTPELTNTFTYGDINITLEETDTNLDDDNDPNTNEYNMTPGATIDKDPTVTVLAGSEDSWLFVKLEESENFADFMTYEIAEGWTALPGYDGVYYRAVSAAEEDQVFPVLKDDQVNVKLDVTKQMLNELDANGAANFPQLIISSYAIQRDEAITELADPVSAWELVVAENAVAIDAPAAPEGESIVTQTIGQ
jgi:hypothetical protein